MRVLVEGTGLSRVHLESMADEILALDSPPAEGGEKVYRLDDDELDSVLFRMYHDPDGRPTRVQLAIGDKLHAQFEQQGGRA